MDPITRYRRAQRAARARFEPFTRAHCPTCETPCCRQPTWVRPLDLILVEELGFSLPDREDPAAAAASLADSMLEPEQAPRAGLPCNFLGTAGCLFPEDLRPFGCVTFVCEPMRRLLPSDELDLVLQAVAEVEAAHTELMSAIGLPADGACFPDPETA